MHGAFTITLAMGHTIEYSGIVQIVQASRGLSELFFKGSHSAKDV